MPHCSNASRSQHAAARSPSHHTSGGCPRCQSHAAVPPVSPQPGLRGDSVQADEMPRRYQHPCPARPPGQSQATLGQRPFPFCLSHVASYPESSDERASARWCRHSNAMPHLPDDFERMRWRRRRGEWTPRASTGGCPAGSKGLRGWLAMGRLPALVGRHGGQLPASRFWGDALGSLVVSRMGGTRMRCDHPPPNCP